MVALLLGGLALTLALRPVERLCHGAGRPWTGRLTCGVCRGALRIIGLPVAVSGAPMADRGPLVANHASWLDILVLNAPAPIVFVSKAEVAGWPGIGWLARATGTVFIRRVRREAAGQVALLRARAAEGQRLLFFPEGTSSDGRRVLPFRTALLAAFDDVPVQPVTVAYRAPAGARADFYGWWGEMALGPSLLSVLSAPRQGAVRVTYHAPVPPGADRKVRARALEDAVRSGLDGAPS
ncbi:lysophospholipid acyltransferase family protein [Wenxinia saemankumensis]|uniref:Lyso-ornithine lipid acyltransferase n=1 Tax=Wenxinia saemankumensis TaxID=1447782 RepID=A0A1M6HIQ9_9RHOB|nr:lysophospholipid acyltransferase family protein [Wenxinia saemankumensis]SHJ22073.1 lyso-ornithine lipid acyltransferase [Wenxinia saemankumensis]